MPPLEQITPPSTRRRWQGTRTSFVDLVRSLETCMQNAGVTGATLNVTIGDNEGPLDSVQELRDQLTETLWLSSRNIRVRLSAPGIDISPWLSIFIGLQDPVFVQYHGGTGQARETLRVLVERALGPDPPDPRRHLRWLRPIFGTAYSATLFLAVSRLSTGHWSIHTGWSQSVRHGIAAAVFILNAVIGGVALPRLAFLLWFPHSRSCQIRLRLTGTAEEAGSSGVSVSGLRSPASCWRCR
jgi:hypothetical protein